MTDAERNARIAVVYKTISDLYGDTMGWMQIETLARRIVDELAKAEQ